MQLILDSNSDKGETSMSVIVKPFRKRKKSKYVKKKK
jgi:hypothetical protein